jgi:Trypsin-like peptidase domain
MIDPQSATEQMMYCTTRILGVTAQDKIVSSGTGFFLQFPTTEDRHIPVLVTNKHVVQGTPKVGYLIHATKDGGTRPEAKMGMTTNLEEWINHPNDKIDLCAIPFAGVLNQKNPTPFVRTLPISLIPSKSQLEELGAVEDILMVGYPNGLWDEENNYPLIRRGITASHPAVDFNVNGVAATVVDIACFPGSSGSPVFIYNNGTIPDKKGNVAIGQRLYLLGVLFSGPVITTDGKIIIRDIPTSAEPVAQVNMMMNLGYIIKSQELDALANAVRNKLGLPRPT